MTLGEKERLVQGFLFGLIVSCFIALVFLKG